MANPEYIDGKEEAPAVKGAPNESLLTLALNERRELEIGKELLLGETSDSDPAIIALGKRFEDYLEIGDGKIIFKTSIESIPEEQRAELVRTILAISSHKMIETMKAGLESADELDKCFIEGYLAISKGDLRNAEMRLKDYMKGEIRDESPEKIAFAKEMLKQIAKLHLTDARKNLARVAKDAASSSIGYLGQSGIAGLKRNEALRIVSAQDKFLNLVEALLSADNDLLSFDEAVEYAKRAAKVGAEDYSGATSIFRGEINLSPAEAHLAAAGIKTKYEIDSLIDEGGYKANVVDGSILDVISPILKESSGEADVDKLIASAEKFREAGMYNMAQVMFDKVFAETYSQISRRKGGKENFERTHQKKIGELISKGLSPEVASKVAWEEELRHSLVEYKFDDPKLQDAFGSYNDMVEFSRAGKSFYELESWGMTDSEWDKFVEGLPADVAVIIASAGTGAVVGKAVQTGLLTAMRTEGRRGLLNALKSPLMQEVFAGGSGFAANSLVFAEMNALLNGLRTGNLEYIDKPKAHLKAWGHSALTLGVLKGIEKAIPKLPEFATKAQKGAKTGEIVLTDTMVLGTMDYYWQAIVEGKEMSGADIMAAARSNLVLSAGMRGVGKIKEKVFGDGKFSDEAKRELEDLAMKLKSSPEEVMKELSTLSAKPAFRKFKGLIDKVVDGEIDFAAFQKGLALLAPALLSGCENSFLLKAAGGLTNLLLVMGVTGTLGGIYLFSPLVNQARARGRVERGLPRRAVPVDGRSSGLLRGRLGWLWNFVAGDKISPENTHLDAIKTDVGLVVGKLEALKNGLPDGENKKAIGTLIANLNTRLNGTEHFGLARQTSDPLLTLKDGDVFKKKPDGSLEDLGRDIQDAQKLVNKLIKDKSFKEDYKDAAKDVAGRLGILIVLVGLAGLGLQLNNSDEAVKPVIRRGFGEAEAPATQPAAKGPSRFQTSN